jgi:hypothetical protein
MMLERMLMFGFAGLLLLGQQAMGQANHCAQYFSIHIDSDWQHSDISQQEATDLIAETCHDQLSIFFTLFGRDEIVSTLQKIRDQNTLTDGLIPIFFSGHVTHPHLMHPGNPFTGVFMSALPLMGFPRIEDAIETLFRHELTHLVLGKFNDGLTEIVANLFKAMPYRGSSHSVLRAHVVASAFDARLRFMHMRKLEDLFSHVPTGRLTVCSFAAMGHSHQETREFASSLILEDYAADLVGYTFPARTPDITPDDKNAWEQEWGSFIQQKHAQNPNETPGYARDYYSEYSMSFARFLLIEPRFGATTQERYAKFMNLYWRNGRDLVATYSIDWSAMQVAFHQWLESQLANALPASPGAAGRFGRLESDLHQDECLLDWASDPSCAQRTDPMRLFSFALPLQNSQADRQTPASLPYDFHNSTQDFSNYCEDWL